MTDNPIEERAAEIASARMTVPADNLIRLVSRLGTNKATGLALGVSGSAISNWIGKDEVPLAYDLATLQLLAGMDDEPAKMVLLIARCYDEAKADAVMGVLKALDIPFHMEAF